MNKNLFITCLSMLGLLFLSPLQAMNEDGENRRSNALINLNRKERDHCIDEGLYILAARYAQKVINETPEAPDNKDATIEDFRCIRNIYRRLSIDDPAYYLDDAIVYAEEVTNFEGVIPDDYSIARDLLLKDGDYKKAAYYNGLISEIVLTNPIK